MTKRFFTKNNKAVAGVIEALLLVALIAIVISLLQLLYIPDVMKQREADHMDDVLIQFSFIKSIMDLQSATKEDVPVTSPVTLGSLEIPYFVTARAFGKIEIIDNPNYEINVDFDTLQIPLTSIRFQAFNSYYSDQIYSLEGGTLILYQPEATTIKEAVKIEPTIRVENQTSNINIYYEIPIIVPFAGKDNDSGYKTSYVRTNYSSSDADFLSLTDVSSIKIYSEFPVAWKNLTENYLGDNVNYVLGTDDVEITQKTKTINFYYKRTYIYAQIGPGFIKTQLY
jgi:hypothetical protein